MVYDKTFKEKTFTVHQQYSLYGNFHNLPTTAHKLEDNIILRLALNSDVFKEAVHLMP